ncbi:hypothetical protein KKF34_06855 [Myxococcota bacterium]|nr:hypothetical protein [Myxococcota bacterium]MBU1382421.1 hypothetical protein [Myxococcota bacterium]MBU1496580.1 hypothetical protein [Myxococcota bacterium]
MKKLYILMVSVSIFFSCKEEEPEKTNFASPGPNTVIPLEGELSNLTEVTDDQLVFSGSDSFTSQLQPGAILMAGSTPQKPSGMLRKVISVSNDSGNVTVVTEQATLAQALEEAEFTFQRDITTNDILDEQILDQGVSRSQKKAEIEGTFAYTFFNMVIVPGVTLGGSISFKPKLTLSCEIGAFEVKNITVKLDLEEKLAVTLSAAATLANWNYEKKFASVSLRPITFMIGIVPVVIQPNINFYIGTTGEVKVKVSTGFSQTATGSFGMEYTNGSWKGIRGFNNVYGFDRPAIEGTSKIKIYEKNEIEFLLYGAVGPAINLSLFMEFEGKAKAVDGPEADCITWDLKGGIEAGVGFNMDAIGLENKTIPDLVYYKAPIANSNECAGGALCGNGVKDEGEQCDIEDFGTDSCESLGYDAEGYIYCNEDCTYGLDFCILCGSCDYVEEIENQCAKMSSYNCTNELTYDECITEFTMALDQAPLCATDFMDFYYCRVDAVCFCDSEDGLVHCEGDCVIPTWDTFVACLGY